MSPPGDELLICLPAITFDAFNGLVWAHRLALSDAPSSLINFYGTELDAASTWIDSVRLGNPEVFPPTVD